MKDYRRIPVPSRVSPGKFLLEFAVLVLASLGASVSLAQKSNAPPVAPVRMVTEAYFGTKVVDLYRYTKNLQDLEVVQWFKDGTPTLVRYFHGFPTATLYLRGSGNSTDLVRRESKQGFQSLFEISVYYHVKDGVHYPAVMVTTGMNLIRVSFPGSPARWRHACRQRREAANRVLLRPVTNSLSVSSAWLNARSGIGSRLRAGSKPSGLWELLRDTPRSDLYFPVGAVGDSQCGCSALEGVNP